MTSDGNDGDATVPNDDTTRGDDDTTRGDDETSPSGDDLVRVERHLDAALDTVTDEQGRYHIRQALQLLAAEREQADDSLLDVE